MRLINTRTLRLEEFFNMPKRTRPAYAILSHTWGEGEVTFNDIQTGSGRRKDGYRKIVETCKQAQRDDCEYAWIDTCCIDKSSSTELSEAINSMFEWYNASQVCYALLSDVSASSQEGWALQPNGHLTRREENRLRRSDLFRSRWFTRGWTLQELLAPHQVEFFDKSWINIGSRSSLIEQVSLITGIDRSAFPGTNGSPHGLSNFSVAQKMAWAAHRQTTRQEDIAYCLLGLFDVSMPLIYGEGEKAFIRLQEEIMRKSSDHTIFVWDPYNENRKRSLLAASPQDFQHCRNLIKWEDNGKSRSFALSNIGLTIQMPLTKIHIKRRTFWAGILNCRDAYDFDQLIALCLNDIAAAEDGTRQYVVVPSSSDTGPIVAVPVEQSKEVRTQQVIIRTDYALPSKPEQLPSRRSIAVTISPNLHDAPEQSPRDFRFWSFSSPRSIYPSTFWKETIDGQWTFVLPPWSTTHAAVEIRIRTIRLVLIFGIDISSHSGHEDEEQPWVYLRKYIGWNLEEVPPPPLESRNSSDYSWLYQSENMSWDVAKEPPPLLFGEVQPFIIHTKIERVNKMGEDIYEITTSWKTKIENF